MQIKVSAIFEISSTYGRIKVAPNAQFKPMVSGFAWRTECQKAVTVWPDKIRPEASVTVPEIMMGKRKPLSSKNVSMANKAALQFSVSKMVSTIKISEPPSTNARVCSK